MNKITTWCEAYSRFRHLSDEEYEKQFKACGRCGDLLSDKNTPHIPRRVPITCWDCGEVRTEFHLFCGECCRIKQDEIDHEHSWNRWMEQCAKCEGKNTWWNNQRRA